VDFADGFGLIRGSNTTPVLVLRFEGHTPERCSASKPSSWPRCAA
jgi:phosphomannomutase